MAVATGFRHAGASDPGRKRSNNEDRYLCDPAGGVYAVVDGMGGQAAGEQAAGIAVNMLKARLARPTGSAADRIREAIAVANNEIWEAARANPEWEGMACVLTVAVLEDGHATIGHVGDTRLYLLSPGHIKKITRDHSPVGEREDRGELSEADAMRHPRRNEVYRDVGSGPHRPDDREFIDIYETPLARDSALLIASDGLTDLVPAAEIRAIVEKHADEPRDAVAALIEAANAAGGKDNITAVLVAGPGYRGVRSSVAAKPEARNRRWLTGRGAFLVYGAALALAGVWAAGQRKPAEPPAEPPRTWTVGPTAESDGATISTVLEKARPGDTVVVAPGEYRETVQAREGVSLLSREPQGAVLRAGGRGVAILSEGVRGARIAGFRIAGDSRFPMSVGVEVKDSAVTLENLAVSGAASAGIEISGDAAPVVSSSRVTNNAGAGIVLRGSAAPQLKNNLIAGNGRAGLEIHDAAAPVLEGNTFLSSGAEPIQAPASIDNAVLERNFFGWQGTARRKVRVVPR